MAGISTIEELEARKRALATQSEICRETLKGDIQNLVLYGSGVRKQFDRIRGAGPWLLLAVPMIAPLLGSFWQRKTRTISPRPSKLKAGIATALLAVRLYRNYGPVVRNLVGHFGSSRRPAGNRAPG